MKDLPPILPDMLFIQKDAPAKPPRTSRRREEARIQRSKGFEAAVRRFRAEEFENGRGGFDLSLRPRKLQVFDMVNFVSFGRGFGLFRTEHGDEMVKKMMIRCLVIQTTLTWGRLFNNSKIFGKKGTKQIRVITLN